MPRASLSSLAHDSWLGARLRAASAIRSLPAPRQPYEPEAPASAWKTALATRAAFATHSLARQARMGRRPRTPRPMGVPGKAQNRSFAKNSARATARAPKASSQRHVLAALGLTCDDTFWGRADLQRNRSPGKRLRVTTLTGPTFSSRRSRFLAKFSTAPTTDCRWPSMAEAPRTTSGRRSRDAGPSVGFARRCQVTRAQQLRHESTTRT